MSHILSTTPDRSNIGALRLAAIDIGSNSVHMIVAQADIDGAVTTLWRVKEMVGLGRISFPSNQLSQQAMDRVIASLTRMKQAATQRQAEKIVAVATSAIREAHNGGDLIERIKRELKLYVKVVPAREEARLIYLGVRAARDLGNKPHLIVDIGGGSVEFIVATAREARLLESRKLGAARMTAQFVNSDPISKQDLRNLRDHYEQTLRPLVARIQKLKPMTCLGTSGTLENIALLCGNEQRIVADRLSRLEQKLIRSTREDRDRFQGLDDHRKDQITAGVILVGTLMRMLNLKQIEICGAALREGILMDYLSRHRPDLQIRRDVPDPRRRSVLDLARRCNWYESHSLHVAGLTLRLFDDLKSLHGLGEWERELIEYGALLHDIGWHIAPKRHHKHSQYLILNGDLKNFSSEEIKIMAKIARFHRKSVPDPEKHKLYASLDGHSRKIVRTGAALLRLADGMDRSHASAVSNVKVKIGKKKITLTLLSPNDIQLEMWAVRKKREFFEKVFRSELVLESQVTRS